MKLTLKRIFKGEKYTIGDLYIDGTWFSNTLEDAIRDVKVYGETAIPAGTYKVTITLSYASGAGYHYCMMCRILKV